MSILLNGMSTMGFLVAALFFLRFWRRTKDQLFISFACAFLLLAIGQVLTALSVASKGAESLLYLPRIAAFGLLIAAIVLKNLGRKTPVAPER